MTGLCDCTVRRLGAGFDIERCTRHSEHNVRRLEDRVRALEAKPMLRVDGETGEVTQVTCENCNPKETK